MANNLENLWVKIIDSPRFRNIAGRSAGGRVLHNPILRELNTTRWHLAATLHNRRSPDLFEDVQTYCMFIGHTKSGGSLIGALLDAHPEVILADEADGLRYVDEGFSREEIFYILLRMSHRELLKGRITARRLEPYSFLVPGQWQGRYRTLRVIGDSKAGKSTQKIGDDPTILDRLHRVMNGTQSRFIHVIRNPFDPISIMMVRGKRSFENASSLYFSYCEILSRIYDQLAQGEIFPVRYENFVHQPDANLGEICRFLGITGSTEYLTACSKIVRPAPDRSRDRIDWQSHWKQSVLDTAAKYDFLDGYNFEN